jgi:hypothetical protein
VVTKLCPLGIKNNRYSELQQCDWTPTSKGKKNTVSMMLASPLRQFAAGSLRA